MSKERELLRRLFNLTKKYLIEEAEPDFIAEIKVCLDEPEWKPIDSAPKKYMHELIGLEWNYELNDWQRIFIVWGHVTENEMGWIDNYDPYRKINPKFYYELPEFPKVKHE